MMLDIPIKQGSVCLTRGRLSDNRRSVTMRLLAALIPVLVFAAVVRDLGSNPSSASSAPSGSHELPMPGRILDWRGSSHWGAPLWLAWIAAAYFVYRHWVKDVYVLAGGVLSVIVIAATFVAQQMHMRDAGAYLFLGLLVIGMSAAGGYWLKQVATEEDS